MPATPKQRMLLTVVGKGILFYVVFTVTARIICHVFGFTLAENGSGNVLTIGSLLTGGLTAHLYAKGMKELEMKESAPARERR